MRLAVPSHQFPRESWMAPSLASTLPPLFFLAHPQISRPGLSGTNDPFYMHVSRGKPLTEIQHLPPHKDRHSIRRLARTQVAH